MSKAVIEGLETRRLLSAVHVSPWDSIEYDPTGRIETSLTRLHDEYAAYRDAGGTGAFTPSESFMTVKGDRVGIEVVREYGDKHPLAEELARLGMTDQTSAANWIDGYLPITNIPDLMSFEGIERIDPIYDPAAVAVPGDVLQTSLKQLLQKYEEYLKNDGAGTFQPDADWMVSVVDGKVGITAICNDGQAANVRKSLEALGLTDVLSDAHTVSGLIPILALKELGAVAGLTGVSAPFAIVNTGSVNSEGDAAMHSDNARLSPSSGFGVTGNGIVVGIISDSFDNGGAGSAATDQATGDLPGVSVLDDSHAGTDEGRAMAQIVHDVAPGASLAFHTGVGSTSPSQFMADAITDLRTNGSADVIVDDLSFPMEPMFQDGKIAQSAEAAVANGVAYFSAAGNFGKRGYESAFHMGSYYAPGSFGSSSFLGGTAHDFDPGAGVDNFQQFTLLPSEQVSLSFQWDQPFKSVSGGSGSASEMDAYVLNAAGTSVLAAYTSTNYGNDAVVTIGMTNGSTTASYNLMLVKRSGTSPGAMKYVDFAGNDLLASDKFDEYTTNSGTVYGQANAANVLAVGAAYWNTPTTMEAYSSRGNTPILFNTDGTRKSTPEIRTKPDVTGPDGVSTSMSGFATFYGTSAAAPHVAAVAALMLQATPSATPAKVYSDMERTALNIGTAGDDTDSGWGFVQANNAIAAGYGIVNSGVLTLTGTSGADNMTLSVSGPSLIVAFNAGSFAYPTSQVSQIVINAGAGNDTINLSSISMPATINGGDGNDLLTGGSGNDVLIGGDGNDVIYGEGGNDNIYLQGGTNQSAIGGDGDDVLYGNIGADLFRGGNGTDTVSYADRTANLTISLDNSGNDGASGEYDNVEDSVENVIGGSGNDTIYGSALANSLWGGGGNDIIYGGAGNDYIYLQGGTNQAAVGDDGDDHLYGDYGADLFRGSSGIDTVDYSGRSDDLTISLDNGGNDGASGEGDNVEDSVENITTGEGDDTVTGSSVANVINTAGGNDVIYGGAGNDILNGGSGSNALVGDDGDDYLYATGTGGDLFRGSNGYDTVDYSQRSDNITILLDNLGNDGASGESDNVEDSVENITTGNGNDYIVASASTNTINTSGGNDTIYCGAGNDFVNGGAGADTIYGQDGDDSIWAQDGFIDSIDGGAGSGDRLVNHDSNDLFSNIEIII